MSSDSPIHLPALDSESRFLARISTRSALYGDLSQLLTSAGGDSDYRRLVIEENVCLRKSASARQKLYQELKGRYLLDPNKAPFQAFLTEWIRSENEADRRLLAYVLFCLNDKTVFTISRDWLYPLLQRPGTIMSISELTGFLDRLAKNTAPEIGKWTTKTLERVVQHYLASIRDFGFAEGKQKKVSIQPSVGAGPTRLLIELLRLGGAADIDIIYHSAFRILGIGEPEVYDHLRTLHQQGGLHFKMQGDIIELGGPR